VDDEAAQELRQSVARFLDRHSPVTEARQVAEGKSFDRTTWRRLCRELDVLALLVPEQAGGVGAGPQALGICAEEFGRVLYPGPWLASGVLATSLLASLADPSVLDAYLPGLMTGEVVGTLALHESTSSDVLDSALGDVATTATPEGGVHRLAGHKHLVPDLALADVVLVTARPDDGGEPGLFLVSLDQDGLARHEHASADQTHRYGSLELRGAAGVLVARGAGLAAQLDRHLDLARLLVAAESVGAAGAVLRMGLDYAGLREQFGRAIGSFQTVKHKFADMHCDLESARYAARAALAEAEDPSASLLVPASVAKVRAGDAFVAAAKENIHLHGGIGYTWEHDAHLFYRRALHNRAFLGHPTQHRERIAVTLGL
jgi:acyl-CoA dehydrogenase